MNGVPSGSLLERWMQGGAWVALLVGHWRTRIEWLLFIDATNTRPESRDLEMQRAVRGAAEAANRCISPFPRSSYRPRSYAVTHRSDHPMYALPIETEADCKVHDAIQGKLEKLIGERNRFIEDAIMIWLEVGRDILDIEIIEFDSGLLLCCHVDDHDESINSTKRTSGAVPVRFHRPNKDLPYDWRETVEKWRAEQQARRQQKVPEA